MHKAYFGSYDEYCEVKDDFNAKYGEGKWKYFLDQGEKILDYDSGNTWNTEVVGYEYIIEYFDSILECIDIEYRQSLGNPDNEQDMHERLYEIRGSIPLNHNDYWQWFYERDAALRLSLYGKELDDSFFKRFIPSDCIEEMSEEYISTYGLGEYGYLPYEYKDSDINAAQVLAMLYMEAGAENVYTRLSSNYSLPEYWNNISIYYHDPNKPGDWFRGWSRLKGHEKLPLGIDYCIGGFPFGVSSSEYYRVEDLVTKFEGYCINPDIPAGSNYLIQYVEQYGIKVDVKYIEVEGLSESNNGRLVSQFPLPATAIYNINGRIELTFIVKAGE